MKKEEIPELLEDSKQEEQKHEELKNYFRLELVKTEKDRTKLN